MQKEKNKKVCYTILFSFWKNEEIFVEQLHTSKIKPQEIFVTCIEKIVRNYGHIIDRRLPGSINLQRELENIAFLSLERLTNAWCSTMSLKNKNYDINIIKTSVTFSNKKNKGSNHEIASFTIPTRYQYYRKLYLSLKGMTFCNKLINKKRARVEKYMLYWRIKNCFLSNSLPKQNLNSSSNFFSLYTIIFEYAGGTYINQIKLLENNFSFLLSEWANKILKEKNDYAEKKLINEEDRLILMKKVIDPIYQIQALPNFINAWSTYFTLSKGLGNIYVIKTDVEELLKEDDS